MGFPENSAAKLASTLSPIVARGQAGLFAEQVCEMAGVCVTNIERNIHHALLRFAKQLSRDVHPQIDVMAERCETHGALE